MKANSFYTNTAVVTAVLSLLFLSAVSCTEEQVSSGDPELELLSPARIEIASAGCDTSVSYSLKNADYSLVSADAGDCEWIGNIDCASEGKVNFTVSANLSQEQRTATLTVACQGAETSLEVEIVQEGKSGSDMPDPVVDENFTLQAVDITAVSLTVHVIPEDKSMQYATMIRPKEQVDMMGDDETLLKNDKLYFESYSESSFMPLSEVVKLFSTKGEKDIRMQGLEQGSDYCFYVYGITSEAEALTGVSKMFLTTEVIEYIDVDFDFDIEAEDLSAEVGVTCSDNSVPFYFDLVRGDTFRGADPDEVVLKLISDLFAEYAAYGFDAEYVIERLASFGSGSYTFGNLLPDTEYAVYAAALDYDGMVVSEAAYEYFTTVPAGDPSKLEVSYRISDVNARGAFVEAFPSDKTVKYFWDVVVDGTTEAQVKSIIDNSAAVYIESGQASSFSDFMANLLAIRGDNSYKYELLEGSTDYVTYSFGITEGGDYATGVMFGDVFTTLEQVVSDALAEVTFEKYFDSEEVAAEYPQFPGLSGMAIVPTKVTVNGSVEGYYYAASHGDLTDTSRYPDDEVIEQLMQNGSTEPMPYWLKYGDITYLSVAYDKNGNFGKVFREKHTLTPEGASPVDEFDPSIMYSRPENGVVMFPEEQKINRDITVKSSISSRHIK